MQIKPLKALPKQSNGFPIWAKNKNTVRKISGSIFLFFSWQTIPSMVCYTHTNTHIGIKIEEGFDETNHGKVGNSAGMGWLEKEIILLVISGISLLLSLFHIPLPFSIAWVAIILCGVPIILEAIIGLVTAFDIKADVLVSLALVASICIGEHFAAGEIAFIMQLGALLEDLTVAKARAGIEKLVHLTPQTARVLRNGTEKIIPAE